AGVSRKLPGGRRRLRAMNAQHRSRSAPAIVLLLAMGLLGACGGAASTAPTGTVNLTLTAGPVCPVEQIPPDPNCAPRPVADAEVIVLTADGREAGRAKSDAAGRIRLTLPQGRYVIRPVQTNTFPSAPGDVTVDVGTTPVDVALSYDTGIR
ncbi:MAG: carboxypeptidase-like regulatory domain-containing protein, partial [Chloroflexota bacterium]|nr:carboxypeptidase-like regulatory domain-containing protein [Chloroflexota bacterium]